jgi:hypothetical protein
MVSLYSGRLYFNQLVRRVVVGAGLSALAVTAACSLTYNSNATQCLSQDDCFARGPAFANTTCSQERVCVPIASVDRACTTNQDCVQKNGGAPFICRKSDFKCLPLTSNECPTVIGDAASIVDDNTVYLGVASPVDPNGVNMLNAVTLAQDEIRRTVGGLPPIVPGGPRRPLNFVFCNADAVFGAGTPATCLRQSNHLADLGIPAVIGPVAANCILSAVGQVQVPRNVITFTPNALGTVDDLNGTGLVFHSKIIDRQVVPITTPFIADYLGPKSITDGVRASTDALKVAIVQSSENQGAGTIPVLVKGLIFNGKSLQDNISDGNAKVLDTGNPDDVINQPDAFAKVATAIQGAQAFAPHIILWVGSPANINNVYVPTNKTWPMATPVPEQLLLSESMNGFIIAALAGLPDVVRQRTYSVTSSPQGFDPVAFDTFKTNLVLFKPDIDVKSINTFAPAAYDSAYLLEYAIASLGNQPVTGPALVPALRKLGAGSPIQWGTPDLPKGLTAVQAGNGILYTGAFGTYTFDPVSGDRAGTGAIVCVAKPPAPATPGIKPTGYSYDPLTGKGVGTVAPCP